MVEFLYEKAPEFKPRYHLDIGCGSGALLVATRARFNCRVVGIEPDDAHRAYVAGLGIQTYPTLDHWNNDTGDTLGEKPDLISLSHVLEHINDPVGYLSYICKNIIDSRGRLLVEVPNLYYHKSLEIAHPFAFSATTLRAVLAKAGFMVVQLQAHGIPISRSPLYLTVLAYPYPEGALLPIQPDRHPKLRRRVGRSLVKAEHVGRRARYFPRRAVMHLRRMLDA